MSAGNPQRCPCPDPICGGRGFTEAETWWDDNGRRHYWKQFTPCEFCNADGAKPVPKDIRR